MTSSSSVSPMLPPSRRTFSARPVGSSRLSVSPCSSRSTIAWCRLRSRLQRAGLAGARVLRQREEQLVDLLRDRGGRGVLRGGDRLDRAALRDLLEQLLLVGGEPADAGDRVHERLDDLRVEHRAAGRDLAHRAGELVALGDAVLEEVGVARRRRRRAARSRTRGRRTATARPRRCRGGACAAPWPRRSLRAGRRAACGCR